MNRFVCGIGVLLCVVFASAPLGAEPSSGVGNSSGAMIFADSFEPRPLPNIILMIMDDVGIDQIESFGYGGINPLSMPSIDVIAEGGLSFRNTWAMPECSPTRSVVLTGRYPLRTNTFLALGPKDLVNSQLSEYEVTVPKLLDNAGYQSAMFGKFHLGGPEHSPAGNGLPGKLGFDLFHGWIEGLPDSIDTTAGGVAPAGTYSCGFVPNTADDPVTGADSGACYVPDASSISCSLITGNNPAGDSPGLQCLTQGGILVPNVACESTPPAHLVWDNQNAHYVSPLVRNLNGTVEETDLARPGGRGYRATLEVNAAIGWIQQQQQSDNPWMATVSFSSAHTPFQHPPGALLPSGIASQLAADCTDSPVNQRRIFDAMTEAIDTEFGRLLVETGVATRAGNGELVYNPKASNTLLVVLGDNGSFAPTVKWPFNIQRSKGTAYQTGVWVPLIVSGPMVAAPGRNVEHMVNAADLYSLFGELAGLDVPSLVPRPLDAEPMLAYLTNPAQESIREFNFAQGAPNLQVNGAVNGPCVMGTMCSHTPMTKSVCYDNGGKWWGVDADTNDPDILAGDLEHCWEVNQAIYHDNPANYLDNKLTMGWVEYRAIRNDDYKLVRNRAMDYDPDSDAGVEVSTEEFYRINQHAPVPLLDDEDKDILAGGIRTLKEAENFVSLSRELNAIIDSQIACPGDGNDDGRVDQTDIDNYHGIVANWSGSSTYDFNLDGFTDAADLQIIQDNLGTVCFTMTP